MNVFMLFIALLLVLSFEKDCLAYLDPGTGSYLFQVFVAGIIGVSFILRSKLAAIRAALLKIMKMANNNEAREK